MTTSTNTSEPRTGGTKRFPITDFPALGDFRSRLPLWSFRLEQWYRTVFKRGLDILCSGTLLILLSPLFAIVAILIKLESRGPVFFHQIRVGFRGRRFRMHKFRSMRPDAEQLKQALAAQNEMNGVTFKMKHDPRITKTGRIIRKFSIDELPQLYNVLIGDMTLVGPRPAVPSEVAEYSHRDRARLDALPGITCIWQVSGRNEIDFDGQVDLDLEYIHSHSPGADLRILLKTIPAVITGRGAS